MSENLDLACRDEPELFFSESPQDVEVAKALCSGCPVRRACLAGAIERREPLGVWGGELFERGVVVPRKRPRGRPRKNTEVAAWANDGPRAPVESANVTTPMDASRVRPRGVHRWSRP
jgi:WhiB family transcriptional regulator, redox-sensing transcriptional regulator